ncbi:MAG: DNA mismatch repair protein MutS [Hydrogenothermaceae bacterium]
MEENLTPMIAQYNAIKNQYKDYLLLYRLGDFYELFYEDAIIGARELNIVLTKKRISKDKDIPMCGIPYHSSESYIAKLVSKGYKVAICEQLEDASQAKGIVKRDVIRVITPGTYFDNEKLKTGVVSIVKKGESFSTSYINLSTGEFYCSIFSQESLISFLNKFLPREVIVEKGKDFSFIKQHFKNIFLTELDKQFFEDSKIDILLNHFSLAHYRAFGIDQKDEFALKSASVVLHYVKITQKNFLPFISPPKLYKEDIYMRLDQNAIKHLEIINSEGGTSLFSLIDRTLTGMGRRKLKFLLLHPLKDKKDIDKRLEAVEELYRNHEIRNEIRDILKDIFDIERLVSKITSNTLTPRDMVSLKHSLKNASKLKNFKSKIRSQFLLEIIENINNHAELIDLLERYLEENPPIHFKEGGLIKDGVDNYLDELRKIKEKAQEWILNYQEEERKRTGISSLKIGYNKVMGYYIEVTKPNLKFVPSNYRRRQTLSNAERFITTELQEFEEKVLSADEKIKNLEYEIFSKVREEVIKQSPFIEETARWIAFLDAIVSLAQVSVEKGWKEPEITEGYDMYLEEAVHPVVANNYPDFVPNSVKFDKDKFLHIITGPNMSGKSTFIRQVGLIVLLAHVGCFIPASSGVIPITDAIYTRIGSGDNLSKGLSTFMVEMLEVANILNNATERSLIILDEVGRGTSTYDGISIAWSLCEKIAKDIKAKTLFSTHYHELTEIEKDIKGVVNYFMAVVEEEDGIRFLYKILEGKSDKSYGIHVAKLAGLPQDVIDRANQILIKLESDKKHENYDYNQNILEKMLPKEHYSESDEIIKMLEDLDIANLTPLQALIILNDIKNSLKIKKTLDK